MHFLQGRASIGNDAQPTLTMPPVFRGMETEMGKQSETLAAPEGLLDQKGAAAFLGCKEQTLADWRCKGIGPGFVKVGRLVRYSLDDLRTWVKGNTYLPKAG